MLKKKLTGHTATNGTQNPTVTTVYTVVSDDPLDGPMQISLQGLGENIADATGEILGWVRPGLYYQFGGFTDPRLMAGKIEVSDPKLLTSSAEYALQVGEDGIVVIPNPVTEPRIQWTVKQTFSEIPEFTIECKQEVEEVRFLYDEVSGNPVVNSAGDFFPSEPKMKIPILVYEITRFEINNPVAKRESYTYAVNADVWCGAEPGTLLMDSVLPTWNGNQWNVKYVMKYKQRGWGEKYLDEGLREIKNGKLISILDPNKGTDITNAVKLDGHGRFPIERDGQGNPILDEKGQVKPIQNFSGVQFPQGNNYYWKYKALPFGNLLLPIISLPTSKITL